MTRVSLALLLAILSASTASQAACLRPNQHAGIRERVAYILRNANFVGLGIIGHRELKPVTEEIVPIIMFKGAHPPSFSVRQIVNVDGSVDFKSTAEVDTGETGALVVFALIQDGPRLIRSECATVELDGSSRADILKQLLKSPGTGRQRVSP